MNALQIRNLLVKIGQELHCPICHMKLSSAHLKVEESLGDGCEVAISCPSCRDEFRGVAHMVPMLTPHGKMLNASSVLTQDKKECQGVDTKEVTAIHEALTKTVSFSDMFAAKAEVKQK